MSSKLSSDNQIDRARYIMQIAELKKNNEKLKKRYDDYFKQVELPMQVEMQDFSDVK